MKGLGGEWARRLFEIDKSFIRPGRGVVPVVAGHKTAVARVQILSVMRGACTPEALETVAALQQ